MSYGQSDRARENRRLTALTRGAFDESRGIYGAPRVHRTLRQAGELCGLNRVARLMRKAELRLKTRRRFRVKTTDSNHNHPIAPDCVDRDFSASAANQIWVSDMTYIATDEGWLYLATTMDLFSRKIVGWSMAPTMHAKVVVDALKMAIEQRRPKAGLIHHSDRGTQYASYAYRSALDRHGVVCSMSRRANCYDNAVVESFFGTLKTELIHRQAWPNRRAATNAIAEYIDGFYNPCRRHSTLGYLSPLEYELRHQRGLQAA